MPAKTACSRADGRARVRECVRRERESTGGRKIQCLINLSGGGREITRRERGKRETAKRTGRNCSYPYGSVLVKWDSSAAHQNTSVCVIAACF